VHDDNRFTAAVIVLPSAVVEVSCKYALCLDGNGLQMVPDFLIS